MMKRSVLLTLTLILVAGFLGCPPKPPQKHPALSVSLTALNFGETASQMTFEVWNSGDAGSTLTYSIASATAWVSGIQPPSGTRATTDAHQVVTVTVNRTGLAEGSYQGTVVVSATGLDPVNVAVSLTIPTATQNGSVLGWVSDVAGNTLPLVEVVLEGQTTTYTDANGLYSFNDVAAGEKKTLRFSKDGYAVNTRGISVVAAQATTANVSLVERAEAQQLPLAQAGGEIEDGAGNAIKLPPAALVDAGQQAVTGTVDVQVTALDVTDEAALGAFPGDFRGLPDGGGEEVEIEPYAAVDFLFTQDGEALNLGNGSTAEVELALPDGAPLNIGDPLPLWFFDDEQGVWLESGEGTVKSDGAGGLVGEAELPHLSWWSFGIRVSAIHCLSGRVLDEAGEVVAGAQVRATGLDYSGGTLVMTDASGEYCLNVKRGKHVRIEATLPGAATPADWVDVAVPNTSSSCATGGCTQVPDLQPTLSACISGYVTEEDGTPIAGAAVYNSFGGRDITASDGYYCMEAPSDTDVTVFVTDRPPVTVHTAGSGSCGGNCVQVNIEVAYPESGDMVGMIMTTFMNLGGVKPNYTSLTSTAMFYASGVEIQEGMFEPVQHDTCTVYLNSASEGEGEAEDIGPLDPGAPGSLSCGPYSASMARYYDWISEYIGEYGNLYTLDPWMMGMFIQDPNVLIGPAGGDTVTYSWPGGIDIGPFTASIQLLAPLHVTSPVLGTGSYANTVDIDLDADLVCQWETASSDAFIQLVVASVILTTDHETEVDRGWVTCTVRDDGAHTIGSEYLSQLPRPGVGQTGLITFSATRSSYTQQEVPLTRGGTGYVLLWSYSSAYASDSDV